MTSATSSGVPSSGHGCASRITVRAVSRSGPINGVTISPGQTVFTRIRSLASSAAATRPRLSTAALAAEYACGPAPPLNAATEAVLTIDPPRPAACMARAPCLMPRNTLRTSTANV